MTKPKIYICSPLRGKNRGETMKNMRLARDYMAIFSKALGISAVAPHAFLPEILDDTILRERALALQFGQAYLALCSGMIVRDNNITDGMISEIKMAETLNIPVFYVSEKHIENIRKGNSSALNKLKEWAENEMLLRENTFLQ